MADTGQSRATKVYTRQALADAVDRSRQQLDEYRRKGCPMTTPAEVRDWMSRHVRPRRGGPRQKMAESAAERDNSPGWLDAFEYFAHNLLREVDRLLCELPGMADQSERTLCHRWLHGELELKARLLRDRLSLLLPIPDASLMRPEHRALEGDEPTTQPPIRGNE